MNDSHLTRRAFLRSLTLAGGAALTGAAVPALGAPAARARADIAGLRWHIEHVIVLFQENRRVFSRVMS